MEQNFNRRIETDLDLNGPHLAISSQPSDATVNHGATQSFSVTASATFPGNTGADDEGTLTYQWYIEDDEGFTEKLTNQTQGVTYSGTTTATLTLTNIDSPGQNGTKYYCVVDYIPADKYGEDGKGTGHPINGSVTSSKATLTVNPYLLIASQPSSVDRLHDVEGNITVLAALSDPSYPNDIGYQWYRNGSPISDGRVTSTRIEKGTVTEVVEEVRENEYEVVTRNNYSANITYNHKSSAQGRSVPSTATNIKIKIAAGGGGTGGDDAPWNLSPATAGGSGKYGEFTLNSTFAGTYITIYAGQKGGNAIHASGESAKGSGGGKRYGGGSLWATGGDGGHAGESGGSGGGGGGGGASGIYHGDFSEPVIVAGGGGGGGGDAHNANAREGNVKDITYTSGFPRQQFGVHDRDDSYRGDKGGTIYGDGKVIRYGDGSGRDTNANLIITSGDATFDSYLKISGSGNVGLRYWWHDRPRGGAGQANNYIYIDGTQVAHQTWNTAGDQEATINLGTGASKHAGGWDNKSSTFYADGGHAGHNCYCADGAGGGGGGAGAVDSPGAGGGTGGAGGCDLEVGGQVGNAGKSYYRGDMMTKTGEGSHDGEGYVNLSYDWYVDVSETRTETEITYREVEREIENEVPQHLDISGTREKTITLKADYDTVQNLYCVVSSPQSSNSPVTSNTVQFSTFSNLVDKSLYIEKAFWYFDRWRGGYATGNMTVLESSSNLNNGEVTLGYDPGSSVNGINVFTSFYVRNDTEIEIDLYGGKGAEWTPLVQNSGLNASSLPGAGGYGRIRFTMKKNREYTVAGMFGTINTPYLYEKDEIIACVGQGGGNNTYGAGGGGGGLNLAGQSGGGGTGNGYGGRAADQSTPGGPNDLRLSAALGSAYYPVPYVAATDTVNNMLNHIQANIDYAYPDDRRDGGYVKRYSRNINNNSSVEYRRMYVRQVNGAGSGLREYTRITNTASLNRGFWDIDYAFLGTAGGRGIPQGAPADDPTNNNGVNTTCVGGNGAWGGAGGYNGSGGGGGSGYLNLTKDITLVNTNTGAMGAGTENSKIVIRLAT